MRDPKHAIAPAAIFQGYLELQKEYEISDKNLIWLFNAFLWASIHYTSVHGMWIGTEIYSHPELFKKLMTEVSKDKTAATDSLSDGDYLEGLIRESIRLHSVFALPRRVKHDLVYKDYLIPKGTILAISPFVEHHGVENFPHPHKIDPARWDNWSDNNVKEKFLPGGLGYFGCIGMNLAIQFLTCTWQVLLKNYDLEIVGEIPRLKERLILLPPKKPIRVKYSKR